MLWLILAIVLWGIVHSLLASTAIKDLPRRALGSGFMKFYRLLYNIFGVISFLPVLYLLITLPDKTLYQVSAPFSTLMRLGQFISLILLFAAAMQTDVLSFAGLRQLFEEEKPGRLVTQGLYGFVRHPLYMFSLLILWLSPRMTLNSLTVYVGLTLYILIGIMFEERKLMREFGKNYEEYRSSTPMLIPGLNYHWNKQNEKTV